MTLQSVFFEHRAFIEEKFLTGYMEAGTTF
jgi:hypothetical protein